LATASVFRTTVSSRERDHDVQHRDELLVGDCGLDQLVQFALILFSRLVYHRDRRALFSQVEAPLSDVSLRPNK
jgi:hypothetical protein